MRFSKLNLSIILVLFALIAGISSFYLKNPEVNSDENPILSYEVNLRQNEIHFFLKDQRGNRLKSLGNLKNELDKNGKELVFAMNGGMFDKSYSPVGLYIEKGTTISKVDSAKKGYGNFYLQPNGIFAISKENKAIVSKTESFINKGDIKYATQSGPMLLINGKIHPKFNENSKNLNIRNGVGLLKNGNLLFAMSKEKINFHSFASFFLKAGCKDALYLDGFVSKTYLPSKNWIEEDGNFGVIIGQFK